ncbi:MAG: lipoate-protein ligase A [Chitinophagales bacterium]
MYISKSNNPFENLALEEWALNNFDTAQQNYLILYINSPAVVIGRNQNIFQELNLRYCRLNKIEITRRISGGGTVFHDEGNLNWTHITQFDTKKVNKYTWAAGPIIQLLESYGLQATLTERNAIEVDGCKLSGQAQFTNRRNIMSHGTLLINSNLSALQGAIEADSTLKIESKASPSVRSHTGNLSKLLNQDIKPDEVIKRLIALGDFKVINELDAQLDLTKLKQDSWIFERSPKFNAQHTIDGQVIHFFVEKAKIKEVKNGKGHLLQDSPFLNQTYEKFLSNYLWM